MGSSRKETSAGLASSSKSKHSKLKSRSIASETAEISNSQEFSLIQYGNRSKSKRSKKSDAGSKNDRSSKHTDDALTQQQILDRIASLSELLSPRIRERAGSIMIGADDSPSAHKSGSLSKSSRKSDASCSTRKSSASLTKAKDLNGDNSEADHDEDSEEDLCGHRAKSVTFNFLSKEKVCVYEGGQIHMDGEGKKFMRYAMELVRIHCHDLHQPWPLVKRSQKEKVIHDLKNAYGTGFSSRWVLGRLSKKWNDYRYKLRKQVRRNPRMKKPADCKKEKAWELFKEDCKKEHEAKKHAAAARKTKPRTGSGGLDSIKAEFFKYYRGYPTATQLEEIVNGGGFKEWIKTQDVSDVKFDARDFAGKGPTKCIFKANEISKKHDEACTSKNNLDMEVSNPSANIDVPSIGSDSEELDIIGLFQEKENDSADHIIKEGDGDAEQNKSGSSANTTSSSDESLSGSASPTSSSSDSDSDKDGSGSDEDESDSAETRSTTPPRKKKTVEDVCKNIYLKRGEPEPSPLERP